MRDARKVVDMAKAHLEMVGWQAVHSNTRGVPSLRVGASQALRKDVDDLTAADVEVVANTLAFMPGTLKGLLLSAVMEEGHAILDNPVTTD